MFHKRLNLQSGETEKSVKITFDIAIGTSASVKIGIEEGDTYIYGLTEQTIKVARDYTWFLQAL